MFSHVTTFPKRRIYKFAKRINANRFAIMFKGDLLKGKTKGGNYIVIL